MIPEVLGLIDSKGKAFLEIEVNLGRIVGESICVSTGPGDEIMYAKRPKRWKHSRFVKNRLPLPSSNVFVVLKQVNDDKYVLITAFIGSRAKPEPWDERYFSRQSDPAKARAESREFWNNHALTLDSTMIVAGTVKRQCPW